MIHRADEWKKAIIESLHEGKGSKDECNEKCPDEGLKLNCMDVYGCIFMYI